MVRRIDASMALVAFFVCILSGLQAGNPFTTIVSTALGALAITIVVGLVVGTMAQRMLDENLAVPQKNPDAGTDSETKSQTSGR